MQNLKLLSAANCRWRFASFKMELQFFAIASNFPLLMAQMIFFRIVQPPGQTLERETNPCIQVESTHPFQGSNLALANLLNASTFL